MRDQSTHIHLLTEYRADNPILEPPVFLPIFPSGHQFKPIKSVIRNCEIIVHPDSVG